jgi:hypothetical protein
MKPGSISPSKKFQKLIGKGVTIEFAKQPVEKDFQSLFLSSFFTERTKNEFQGISSRF